MAFSEVVGAGCKQLALSSPYSHEYAEEMLEATKHAAKEYNTILFVEPELLITKLFPGDVAKDKTVILIALDQSVLDEYHALKRLKVESDEKGNPDDIEDEIAKRFGVLLSYDEATLERLLATHG
jgi:hypothetical protein